MSGFEAKRKAAELAEIKTHLEELHRKYVILNGGCDTLSSKIAAAVNEADYLRAAAQNRYDDND
jgi:hypothetical protein